MRAQELERPAEVADTCAGPEQLRNADVEIKRADEPEQKPAYFAETPVFQEVSDIPIKVGETETVEQPGEARPLEIQLGEKLMQVLKQGESKVELQLEPRNLGRVQVEMTWDQEGTLRVSMYAENSRTRTLLEQDLAGLRSVLSQNTQQEVRVEVSRQQESQQQNFYDGGSGGQNGRQQQEQHQGRQQNGQDFLHQLRLGLVSLDGEIFSWKGSELI